MTRQAQECVNVHDIVGESDNLYERLAERIVVVLVETSDPGNIGASARAMKTMALRQLRLVKPLHFPHPKASWRAANATDVAEKAQVYHELAEAVGDCQLVLAASARSRSLPWPLLNLSQTGSVVVKAVESGQRVALVFGRERTGLTNDELQQCHRHVTIATSMDYRVLNLSHAVQLVCYEILRQFVEEDHTQNSDNEHFGVPWDQPLASCKDTEAMLAALERVLIDTGFYSTKNPDKLIPRLHRMFMRTGLDSMEVNIWRGIISHFQSISERRAPSDKD